MPARRRDGAGFSLVEVLVVIFLMSIVISSLAIMQTAMLQDKGKLLRDVGVHNEADYARRQILQVVSEATVLMSPDVGTYSNELIGWRNLDSYFLPSCNTTSCSAGFGGAQNWKGLQAGFCAGGTAACNTHGIGVTWFRFCYEPTTRQLFYYTAPMNNSTTPPGTFKSAVTSLPTTACGAAQDSVTPVPIAGATGTLLVRLIRDVPGASADWTGVFHRLRNNFVEVGFSVESGQDETTKVRAQVITAANILAPSR